MNLAHLYAEPDLKPRRNPFDHQGRLWIRAHPKVCPQCGAVFYAWMPQDAPEWYPPHRVDPEPQISTFTGWADGLRETCGDGRCADAERDHQRDRSPAWHKALEAHRARVEAARAAQPAGRRLMEVGGVAKKQAGF